MAKFSRVHQSLDATAVDRRVMEGATVNDYVRSLNLVGGDFTMPTVCAVIREGDEPVFLSREAGEWDEVLDDKMEICLISYPQWEGLIIGIIVAIITFFVARALYNGSSKPQPAARQDQVEKQPTYEFDDQKNSNRLGQPIPIQYGRIRSYMDVGAKSYLEYDAGGNDDEFIYLFLMVGAGTYTIEAIQIDDTDVSNFNDVTANILNPGDTPSVFPTIVQSTPEVSSIELTSGGAGPFVAATAGYVANRIDIDIEFPAGLFTDSGVGSNSVTVIADATRIGDDGLPLALTIEIVNEVITETQITPVRRTFSFAIPAGEEGRYEVSMRRIGDTDTDSTVADKVNWVRLKMFSQELHPDYGDKTFIEIKVKATDQLNSSNLGIFNVIATRHINVWDGASFTLEASTSVVWAWYDLLTNKDYGIGLDGTKRTDIAELLLLSSQFDLAKFECNTRLENSMSGMDALTQIAQAARCQVYQRSGKVWMVRDERKLVATAFYSPENISLDSLNINWQPPSELSPNHHRVTYFDEDTWQQEQVICALPDTVLNIFEDVVLKTITNRQKAFEHGIHLAAQDKFRRKTMTFETDIEGFLPNFLDPILVSHDMFTEYTAGIVQDYNGVSFFLSDPPDFLDSEFGYISFKRKNGEVMGPFVVVPGPTPYQVDAACFDIIANPIITQRSAPTGEPTPYSFGVATAGEECLLLSITPAGKGRVRIKCVNDDERVYAASEGASAPPRGQPFLVQS